MVESLPNSLYLLGNIQTGKSEKKTLVPRMSPGLEENLLSQASTYLGTSSREKVRNYFYPSERSQASKGVSGTTPYLFKEHREGKKGEKILVPVRFSRARPEERIRGRHERRALFCLGDVSVESEK
jgi:hypothetical protein